MIKGRGRVKNNEQNIGGVCFEILNKCRREEIVNTQ